MNTKKVIVILFLAFESCTLNQNKSHSDNSVISVKENQSPLLLEKSVDSTKKKLLRLYHHLLTGTWVVDSVWSDNKKIYIFEDRGIIFSEDSYLTLGTKSSVIDDPIVETYLHYEYLPPDTLFYYYLKHGDINMRSMKIKEIYTIITISDSSLILKSSNGERTEYLSRIK